MANTQTTKPIQKPAKKDSAVLTNEHNKQEHDAKLAREAEKDNQLGEDGLNEHNRREHEEKMARQAGKSS